MGARIARIYRNFNLENRVMREISRDKPVSAPRHAGPRPGPVPGAPAAETPQDPQTQKDPVTQKDHSLLDLLKSVYVEATDPAAEEPKRATPVEEAERRELKVAALGDPYGLVELSGVTKGKLTVTEALKALGSHQSRPQVWTPEKVAQEYSLDVKDTKALLEYFCPFRTEILPPKAKEAKRIKAS